MQVNDESGKGLDQKEHERAQRDLDTIRNLLVKPEIEQFKRFQQENMSEFITQAIHLREDKDKSISATIAPIVRSTVKDTMVLQRKEFTDYMFPLVGELVRKYVYASMRDFIERTNQIIESSVSLKGLLWRFKAMRAGISFAQYVISQTYVYRVEQVLLIHRETGLLLSAASRNKDDEEHSELVSAMLTAINDFVSDSFKTSSERGEQSLDEIKTDNLSLFLFRGPKAMLVAAVNGNIAPEAKQHFQESLDTLHTKFYAQLEHFSGDTEVFVDSNKILQACLLEEEKIPKSKKKKPIFAVIAVLLFACVVTYYAFLHWQTSQAVQRLQALSTSDAIVPLSIKKIGIHDIELKALRGANARSLYEWAQTVGIEKDWLRVSEYPYAGKSQKALQQQITYILSQFPELEYNDSTQALSGSVSASEYDQIISLARFIESDSEQNINTDGLKIITREATQSKEAMRIGFEQLAAEISQFQIDFGIAESDIRTREFAKLDMIAERFKTVSALAQSLNEDAFLLVIGSSDNSGTQSANIALGLARADAVATRLVSIGIPEDALLQTSVLPIDTDGKQANARKALLTVIHSSQVIEQEN